MENETHKEQQQQKQDDRICVIERRCYYVRKGKDILRKFEEIDQQIIRINVDREFLRCIRHIVFHRSIKEDRKYVKQHEVLYYAFYDAFSSFTNKPTDVHFAGKNNFLKQPEFNNIGVSIFTSSEVSIFSSSEVSTSFISPISLPVLIPVLRLGHTHNDRMNLLALSGPLLFVYVIFIKQRC